MRASRLSRVRMRGLLRMRSIPLDSAAERRTARLMVLSIEPKVRPRAPPDPVPPVAGGLTAKFGFATVRVKGLRPAVGVLPSLAPPAKPIELGNASPVGLPVAEEKVVSPPHW